MLFLSAVYGQAPVVTITVTDPYTISGRYIRAIRDQDVVLDCFVENLPPLTTVSVLHFVYLNMDLLQIFVSECRGGFRPRPGEWSTGLQFYSGPPSFGVTHYFCKDNTNTHIS